MKLKEKIAFIQNAIDGLSKDATNPFFNSSYVDLNTIIDAIRPLEIDMKVSITMPLTSCVGQPAISLKVKDLETDDVDGDTMPLPQITDPQKMGSAITYYRRYMLMSFFNLKAEDDDDGNLASNVYNKKVNNVNTPKIENTKHTQANNDLDW